MIKHIVRKETVFAALMVALTPSIVRAQVALTDHPEEFKKAAVIPIGNKDGTDGAREKTSIALRKFLEKRGCHVIEGESVRKAFETVAGETPGVRDKLLVLNEKDLLKIGRALNVDYVVALNIKWHTKSIYVFPTLRTKADCTADAMVVDVAKAEVTLDRHNIKADSENKNIAAAVASAVTYLGAGAVSGGPKTPPQTIAGAKVVYAALEPFLLSPTGPRKIEDIEPEKEKKAEH